MMSVVTLTATGLLCYAGHVCNYYVKTLEWFRELPAVLRDKRWFLIKRRQSLRRSSGESVQKKPTTANRLRLEQAIRDAIGHLPNVYRDSIVLPEELSKFPIVGEREMAEQAESLDLTGSVHIPEATFMTWMACGVNDGGDFDTAAYPCARAIMRYAVDQQGVELRGAVTGDTAWELCGRLLTGGTSTRSLSSTDLAQLIVYWLEQGHLPDQMRQVLYKGMVEDLTQRGKTCQTELDSQAMQCRWVKLLLHGELDAVREGCAARGDAPPVDLAVEGGLLECAGAEPATVEAERQAEAITEQLRQQLDEGSWGGEESWGRDWEDWGGWEDDLEDWPDSADETVAQTGTEAAGGVARSEATRDRPSATGQARPSHRGQERCPGQTPWWTHQSWPIA